MKVKQLVLFLVLGGATIGGLVLGVGPWRGAAPRGEQVAGPTDAPPPTPVTDGPRLNIDAGQPSVSDIRGVFIQAPPEYIVWNDPDNPGDPVEISTFYAWTFRAREVKPLARGEGAQIGALCTGVVFETFRKPRSHIEALALARQDRGAQAAVLHRRMEAGEARVYGKIALQLLPGQAKPEAKDKKFRIGRDSEIRFTKQVQIHDADEGLHITGEELTAYPKLGTASGAKQFVLKHAAFVISGTGIRLNKIDDGRAVAEILKNASLQLLEDPRKAGNPSVLSLDAGEFRRATVTAEGGALVRRDELVAGERLRIDMRDFVHLEQEGGRSLDAQRLLVEAIRDLDPKAVTKARSGGWRLRRLEAHDGVFLKQIDETERRGTTVLTARTEHLTHDVPAAGAPTTLLEGVTTLTFEGDVPVDGQASGDGMVRASCRERLWIGPVVDQPAPAGVPAESLRRVLLVGDARLERHSRGKHPDEDILEGDEVELIFFSAPLTKTGDPDPSPRLAQPGPDLQRVTALAFTAKGHVRLGGTRINGSMDRLIGRDLATAHPKISAIGKGTRVSFPEIRTNQRLVGRDPEPGAPTATESSAPERGAARRTPRGHWQIRRMTAQGDVRVRTSLGGPAIGLATTMSGSRLTYEELSNLAQLDGSQGNPAFVSAASRGPKPNTLRAQSLRVDRGRGRVSAKGGVKGQLWTERTGFNARGVRDAFRRADPAPARVLEITTDDRIEINIVRIGPTGGVQRDAEQLVKIHGPLTAELRSARMVVDRLRADSLELALVLASKPPADASGQGAAFPGLARATPPGRPGSTSTAGAGQPALASGLVLLTLDAGEVEADLVSGTARRVQAFGGVRLQSEMGEVLGDRITYDAVAKTVDVIGGRDRQAEAWFKTEGGMRNEVAAARFVLTLGASGATRIQADPAPGAFVRARLFNQAKTPATAGKPPQIDGYNIFASGSVDIRPHELVAGQVTAERRVSTDHGRTWSEPTMLWAQTLRVHGRGLLSAGPGQGAATGKGVETVIAEGPKTTIQTGKGQKRVTVRGQRMVLNATAETARITGSPVVLTTGDAEHGVDGTFREVTINLKTGLPSVVGPKIILRPDPKKNR